MTQTEPWHLDKRVPLALIGVILLQTLALGWWAATITARVQMLESQQVTQHTRLESVRDVASDLSTDIAVIDERTTRLLEMTQQLVVNLDRLAVAE
jgi:hypothetical protein